VGKKGGVTVDYLRYGGASVFRTTQSTCDCNDLVDLRCKVIARWLAVRANRMHRRMNMMYLSMYFGTTCNRHRVTKCLGQGVTSVFRGDLSCPPKPPVQSSRNADESRQVNLKAKDHVVFLAEFVRVTLQNIKISQLNVTRAIGTKRL
jgi:hypothetical protein